MKMAKNLVAAVATAALATSMVCVAPAAAASAAPANPEVQSTYATMAKAKKVSLKIGETATLKVKGAKVTKWTTSNKSVATVSKKGKVTGKKAGTATITAKTKKGKSQFTVTVTDPRAATLEALHEYIAAYGTEQPSDDPYSDTEIVLPLTDDGSITAVYEVDYASFKLVYAADGYEFSMLFELLPDDLGNFVFAADGQEYYAPVKMASYKFGTLKWESMKGSGALSSAEEEALNDTVAPAGVYAVGKALNDKLGIQLNDLGFSSLSSF